jgi:hypothetical protein
MNFIKLRVVLCLLAAALLWGCGSPGVPVPPSLELARPVNNLRATRKGNTVLLRWSPPTRTTDGHNIAHPFEAQICGNPGSEMKECGTPVAKIKVGPGRTGKPGAEAQYTDQLPHKLQMEYATADIFYAINVVNSYGRSAGLSNQVSVPAAPTMPPPTDFQAQVMAQGVQVSWETLANVAETPAGLRYAVRLYRREQGQHADTIAGEVPIAGSPQSFVDRGLEWEKTYDYRATVVTYVAHSDGRHEQVEGDDTNPASVFAHDVFPPATPTGLQAVFSGPGQKPFIDLIWSPNTEPDLAGYNVYRREGNAEAVKVNTELVKSPAWRDSNVNAGRPYSYSVSAIDQRGDESPRSEEATESVPAQELSNPSPNQ